MAYYGTPKFTSPSDRAKVGPTPTIFGTCDPGSTVRIYETNTTNLLGEGVTDSNGNFAIGIHLPKSHDGAFNPIGANAELNGELSPTWAPDLTLIV